MIKCARKKVKRGTVANHKNGAYDGVGTQKDTLEKRRYIL